MAHRITVITFFLSSKHIIIYDNTTLACLKMVSLVCNSHLLHLAWLWYQTGFYVEHESTMADPGEGPGGPSSPLFLVQTEAQGAEKNFLGDQAPLIARSGSGTEVWCLMIIIHAFYKWVNKTQVCSVSSSAKPWREWLKRDCLQFSTGLVLSVFGVSVFTHSSYNETLLYLIKHRCCWQVVSEHFPHLQSHATWCLFGPGLCISLACSSVTTYLCCFVKGWKEKIKN